MLGTKVVLKLRGEPKKKKTIIFLGKPQQYHLYLLLKEDIDFCPCPLDNDSDSIKEEYDNVDVEMFPIQIESTLQRKVDYAKDFLKKAPEETIPQGQDSGGGNKYVWNNIVAHKANELIVAIGGYYLSKDKKYILFEEEKPLYNSDGVYVG